MPFHTDPGGYAKTILSDLQGAWSLLRSSVEEAHPFPGSEQMLFQIDEAMSWESVRNLNHMKNTLILIVNLANQNIAPQEVQDWLCNVNETLDSALIKVNNGEIK